MTMSFGALREACRETLTDMNREVLDQCLRTLVQRWENGVVSAPKFIEMFLYQCENKTNAIARREAEEKYARQVLNGNTFYQKW